MDGSLGLGYWRSWHLSEDECHFLMIYDSYELERPCDVESYVACMKLSRDSGNVPEVQQTDAKGSYVDADNMPLDNKTWLAVEVDGQP